MNISIRQFTEKDIENKIRWVNDSRNNRYLHYDLPLNYDSTLQWFYRNKDRKDRYDAVIEVDGVPVGLIGLLSIDRKNDKAELYIMLGELAYKNKGVAKLACKILLEFSFLKVKLNKIYLYTEKENRIAQKLFENIGFIKEGLLKQDLKKDDDFVDRYTYGLCRSDYSFRTDND